MKIEPALNRRDAREVNILRPAVDAIAENDHAHFRGLDCGPLHRFTNNDCAQFRRRKIL
jgi:hypothetical protein